MLDINLRTPTFRLAIFVRRLMSQVLTQIYEHESFFTLSSVRGSMFITTQAWNDTGTQESLQTTHHRAVFSSVVSKSEGPRSLIVAHAADKLRSSGMEYP